MGFNIFNLTNKWPTDFKHAVILPLLKWSNLPKKERNIQILHVTQGAVWTNKIHVIFSFSLI